MDTVDFYEFVDYSTIESMSVKRVDVLLLFLCYLSSGVSFLAMERLLKKCGGVKFQVDVIYDFLSNTKADEATGVVKTTMKTLESKRNALFVYREKYEKLFEELCIEADPESLVNIQGDYKTFQEKCTGIEEIIDIMLQNFFGDKFKEDKTEETSMLEVVKELCDSQMESLRKITA